MMNTNRKSSMLAAILATFVLLASGCGIPASKSVPPTEHEAGFAQANGITIAYESFGSPARDTVLLIVGTGMQLGD